MALSGQSQTSKLIALGSTNLTQVKGAPGHLVGFHVHNVAAAVRYLKFYDALSASVTVGTTVPKLTLGFAATSVQTVWLDGVAPYFSTGISFATTNLAADADTTAVTAGDLIINLFYA